MRFARIIRLRLQFICALLTLACPVWGQTSAAVKPADIVGRSALIFYATVVSVEGAPSAPDGVPEVQVTFHVTHPVRGVRPGQRVVIREWAGLWASGDRYRAGEQVVLFLHADSDLGLTSPVAGASGQFPIAAEAKNEGRPSTSATRRMGPDVRQLRRGRLVEAK